MAERSPMTPEEEHALRIAMWQAEEAEGVEERDALEAEVERLRRVLDAIVIAFPDTAGAVAWEVLEGGGE